MMIVRRLRDLVGLASLIALCAAARADVVDQAYVPSPSNAGTVITWSLDDGVPAWLAQSFTAGLSGQLTAVDLAVWGWATPQQDLRLQVHEVDGLTVGSLLGTAIVPAAAIPVNAFGAAFPEPGNDPVALRVDLSHLGIHVAAGSTYALAVSAGGRHPAGAGDIDWLFTQEPGDHYPGGRGMFGYSTSLQSGQLMDPLFYTPPGNFVDLGFRTYVSAVPEGSTAQLAALGLLVVAAFAGRRGRPSN